MRGTSNKKPIFQWIAPSKIAAQVLAEERVLTKKETDQLSSAVQAKIVQLNKKLAKNASPLKKEMKNYLEKMTDRQLDGKDGLSNVGMIFSKDSPKKINIRLKSGEGNTKKGAEKIAKITVACVTTAKEDLIFLKKALKTMKNKSEFSEEDRSRLIEILDKNSYFRFLEIT